MYLRKVIYYWVYGIYLWMHLLRKSSVEPWMKHINTFVMQIFTYLVGYSRAKSLGLVYPN